MQFRRGPAAVTRSKLQMPLVVILGRWSELWIGVRRTALATSLIDLRETGRRCCRVRILGEYEVRIFCYEFLTVFLNIILRKRFSVFLCFCKRVEVEVWWLDLGNKVSHQCIYLFVTGLDNLSGLLPFSSSLCARTFFSIACVGVRGKSNHHIFCDGCFFWEGTYRGSLGRRYSNHSAIHK